MNRDIIEQPFPPELIKTRPGNFGRELSYVEASHYIQRLNDAFDGVWSFEIVEHTFDEKEVIVLGKFSADGMVKMAFGGSEITRKKENGEIMCLADDLKAASTDALKKAASFLGLGLHLYNGIGVEQQTSTDKGLPDNGNGNNGRQKTSGGNGGNGNGRITSRQLDAILSIGKERGMDRTAVRQHTHERYGRNLEFISKADASELIGELKAIPPEARQ